MPAITIDDQGHRLYYEDTGAPPDVKGVYTTLMIIHGTSFHSQIFRRFVPLAADHSLRLVLVNRRDYPGSSPYTKEDLEKIAGGDIEKNNEFAKARALEFALFIETIISKESIPKASGDWKQGGIVLMGWSSGNLYILPLFSYVDSIPEHTRQCIEPYLRSLVLFEFPRVTGIPQSLDILSDLSLSEEERARHFSIWVSSYFSHKSLTSHNFEDLQVAPDNDPAIRRSTIESMTPDEIRDTIYPPPTTGSETDFRNVSPAVLTERSRRALFDDELARGYWPRVGVDVVWGEKSIWPVIDAMWELQKARKEADEDGIIGRPLRFHMMSGANHFPHWDEPEMTMKFFGKITGAL